MKKKLKQDESIPMTIHDFSRQLKEFLWSSEALALIPDFGWNDGGCRSLMKAFQIWLGGANTIPHQLVKRPNQYHAEHAFVQVGRWFLDGDGVSSTEEMEIRWFIEEGFPEVFIRPFDPSSEPDHTNGDKPHYIEDEKIETLARMLAERFDKEAVLQLLRSKEVNESNE